MNLCTIVWINTEWVGNEFDDDNRSSASIDAKIDSEVVRKGSCTHEKPTCKSSLLPPVRSYRLHMTWRRGDIRFDIWYMRSCSFS
jgi:hypothetical protein